MSPLLLPLVQHLITHSDLENDDRRAILELPARRQEFDRERSLVEEGDSVEFCGVLIEGFACRQRMTGAGERQILSIHVPGDAIDFQNVFLTNSDHDVVALTSTVVAMIPRQALVHLFEARPVLARAMLTSLLIESSIYRDWLLNIGKRNARSRIAHFLCEFAERTKNVMTTDGLRFQLPMTQEQIGDALSLTSVHVNRVLKSLETDGLISRKRRDISFIDIAALRVVGDFDPRYLHRKP